MAHDGEALLAQQLKGGEARCPGVSFGDMLAADTHPVPQFLLDESYEYLGSEPLRADRYTSPDFFKLEVERMWPNVWQFAAREEDLPEAGDTVVYENVGRSYLVTRQEDGSVRAFHNVCLHRGRKLRLDSGWAKDFKCPFHGFTWNTDGSLKEIPCRWDFGHLPDTQMQLPEAQVGRWQGYIFIKDNPGGPTLEEFLAPLPEHFARWDNANRMTAVYVGKVIRANWKATSEAFMEAWHSIVTHPQILPFTGDANTRYNIYGDHVNVAITPFAVKSPHIADNGMPEQWILDEFMKYSGRGSGKYAGRDRGVSDRPIPEGVSARAHLAEMNRERHLNELGYDRSDASDAEMLDNFTYNVFPNMAPWGGFMPNIVYRWRPWPDQDSTLMEVRILAPVPKGQPVPKAPPMKLIPEDQPWAWAEELGALGGVFDQDMANLPYVQEGLKASRNGEIQLGDYQEIRIRHFHRTLDKYIERFAPTAP